ncbi:FAD-dependent monooxygenase [Pseudonocardia oroxyli]|uniref:2-polyprenyl-6-methoxyphenol hydroxylase n=1 Tax=Pseudonocardia oroxyli TaxID=366584 RepID=A0A1G7PMV7_PSEOR|nr:FAD-dependent monooxygenase [Pseudonocardia oroxyli]SDF87556.1 2-polyprenyl-6-methoxyphenol hydroxylase [Pseudonocardia oroxyli]
MKRTALVSGAGIAGPALAYWLHRQGFAVTVVEAAPGPRPGGQTVDLRGAGRTVIERMGLLPAVRAACLDQEGIAYVDAAGRHRAEMRVEDLGGDGIVSEFEILRGDLARILLEATPEAEYLYGRTVTALDDRLVTLSDGQQREVDVIVGADGPHSGVRRLAFGPEERFVHPLGGYTAWFTAPDPVGLAGWYAMYNEPGRVASIRPDSTPGQAKAGLSFLSDPLPRMTQEAARELVAQKMAGMGWVVPRLVESMRTAPDFLLDLVGQVRMDGWTSGRVALVGDAGYGPSPLTGLGTSLALVGAYVLAGELGAHGDVADAFAAYERRMRPYVTLGQTLPPGGITGYLPRTDAAIRNRMWTMRLMVSRPLRGLSRRLFFSRAETIDLPAYPELVSGSRPG